MTATGFKRWKQDTRRKARKRLQMSDAFQIMLDSGWLYFAAGAVICIILGVGALKRLFQGAKKAEPPDPRPRHKH